MTDSNDSLSTVERRLATILMADVFGYSRMMGEDEERTIRTLRGHRAVFDEMIALHRGRVFNTAGDAILAEFPSAVEAVRCATEIQSALRTRNEQLPENQRMWFRVGINLGDVVVQGGDLLGDGVNVAARIQTIADPGGICISGTVYDQIRNKLSLTFRQLGEKNFKNIEMPVRTFSVGEGTGGPRVVPLAPPARSVPVVAIAIFAAVCIAAGGGYWLYRDQAQRQAVEARVAAEAQAAATAQKEAKLAAELQAAKDALAQAEDARRKTEQDRIAADAAQREARLAGELRAARDALQKSATGAKVAAAPSAVPPIPPATSGSPPVPPPPVAPPTSVDRFDGLYAGRMCKGVRDGAPRCGPVSMTIRNSAFSGNWMSRVNAAKAAASGSIAADGRATLAIEAQTPEGATVKGAMTGQWVNNVITFTGTFDDGTSGNATLTWAPDRPAATAAGAVQRGDGPLRKHKQ